MTSTSRTSRHPFSLPADCARPSDLSRSLKPTCLPPLFAVCTHPNCQNHPVREPTLGDRQFEQPIRFYDEERRQAARTPDASTSPAISSTLEPKARSTNPETDRTL